MDPVVSKSKAHSNENELKFSKLPNESTEDALKRQHLYFELRKGNRSNEDLFRVAMDNEPRDPYKQLYAALGLLSKATNGMSSIGGKPTLTDPKALELLEKVVASEDVRASIRKNIISNDSGLHALPKSFMEKLALTSAPFEVLTHSFYHLAESKSAKFPEIAKAQFDRILNDPKLAHSYEGLFIIQEALVTMGVHKIPLPSADRRLVNAIVEIVDKNYPSIAYPKVLLDVLEKAATQGKDQVTRNAAINAIKHLASQSHPQTTVYAGKDGKPFEHKTDRRDDAKAVLVKLGVK